MYNTQFETRMNDTKRNEEKNMFDRMNKMCATKYSELLELLASQRFIPLVVHNTFDAHSFYRILQCNLFCVIYLALILHSTSFVPFLLYYYFQKKKFILLSYSAKQNRRTNESGSFGSILSSSSFFSKCDSFLLLSALYQPSI